MALSWMYKENASIYAVGINGIQNVQNINRYGNITNLYIYIYTNITSIQLININKV